MSKRAQAAIASDVDGQDGSEEPAAKTAKAARGGLWKDVLTVAMSDPALVVQEDSLCVVIRDKYPKARCHLLVLPRENVRNLKELKREHVELLLHLEAAGRDAVRKSGFGGASPVRYGYHAVPSLSRLHLHAISQDFDSECMKTKKHWNSFTTDYFVPHEKVVAMLRETGCVQLEAAKFESLLKQPLRCHVCKETLKTVPALKAHIKGCVKKL